MQDAVVPSYEGPANLGSGSGTLQKSLSDQLALPVVGMENPGGVVQFRGLGRSAEDTDVQALGIPLNPPQGGGFDLSIFPQFLWAGYEYQAGPALGTFDPRGTAGSLTLVPWTAQALGSGAFSGRISGLGSTANVYQVSAAASDGKSLAVVAGSSSGDAQGPSAALSGRWRLSEGEVLSFHLLMTDIDAKTPGPANYTPFAHQQTVRGIPLVQLDSRVGSDGLLKSSVFFDDEYLRWQDPASSSLPATQDHILQLGTENALLVGDWKFGAGLRGVRYGRLGFDDQSEMILNLLASRTFEPGRGLLIEPTVRAVGVSDYAVEPEASLGVRGAIGEQAAWFVRGGMARHFPSMLNRFYSYGGFVGYPGFTANPALQPERDWTATTGVEFKGRRLQAGLQAYGQVAQDAQVVALLDPTHNTELNLGEARIASLMGNLRIEAAPWLDLGGSFTLSASQLTQTGVAFPGLPGWLSVASVGVHSDGELAGGGHRWEGRIFERISSVSVADASGDLLPAYHEEDLEFRARIIGDAWTSVLRVEDLTDQRPQLVAGYPGFGRTVSVLVSRGL